ncbi:MAG: hypothetical protein P1V51_22525, partial [Deltaproteobacteria bacterium]|nr:hypothetical protein [Deltaproteobacteria bacterium]
VPAAPSFSPAPAAPAPAAPTPAAAAFGAPTPAAPAKMPLSEISHQGVAGGEGPTGTMVGIPVPFPEPAEDSSAPLSPADLAPTPAPARTPEPEPMNPADLAPTPAPAPAALTPEPAGLDSDWGLTEPAAASPAPAAPSLTPRPAAPALEPKPAPIPAPAPAAPAPAASGSDWDLSSFGGEEPEAELAEPEPIELEAVELEPEPEAPALDLDSAAADLISAEPAVEEPAAVAAPSLDFGTDDDDDVEVSMDDAEELGGPVEIGADELEMA